MSKRLRRNTKMTGARSVHTRALTKDPVGGDQRGVLAELVEKDLAPCIKPFKTLPKSQIDDTSRNQSQLIRGNGARGADDVEQLVHSRVLEDLDITASVYEIDPQDLFEDVHALIVLETACSSLHGVLRVNFHSVDTDPADVLSSG